MNNKTIKVTASDVAKYVIARFHDVGEPITNLKLQKLLYYIQGWYLGLYGVPAFYDDFQAWVHGPVQPKVYDEYKKYGWNPITEPIDNINKINITRLLKDHTGHILEYYSNYNAFILETMTHQETPWIEARGNLDPDTQSNNIISPETMKKYFTDRGREEREYYDSLKLDNKDNEIESFTSVKELYKSLKR